MIKNKRLKNLTFYNLFYIGSIIYSVDGNKKSVNTER